MRVALVDTSALVPDVIRSVRRGRRSPLLRLMRAGSVRAFGGQHIWAEAPRVLSRVTAEDEIDTERAEAIWWDAYVPLIRVVDTSTLVVTGEAAAVLAARDPSDLPTAKLVSLLGPVPVLATDGDLIMTGLAYRRWHTTVEAAGQVHVAEEALQSSAVAAGGVAVGTAALGRLAWRWTVARPNGAGVALGIAAGLGLGLVAGRLRMADSRPRRTLRSLGSFCGEFMHGVSEHHRMGSDQWSTTLIGETNPTLESQVARLIAATSEPLSAFDVARHLRPLETDRQRLQTTKQIQDVFQTSSAFVDVGTGWELGRAGATYGGPVFSTPIRELFPNEVGTKQHAYLDKVVAHKSSVYQRGGHP